MPWCLTILMLASWLGRALAISSIQVMALATHAFADIPLEVLALAKFFSSVPMASKRPLLVESMKWWNTKHLNPKTFTLVLHINFGTPIHSTIILQALTNALLYYHNHNTPYCDPNIIHTPNSTANPTIQ